jgi:hypothetical protein
MSKVGRWAQMCELCFKMTISILQTICRQNGFCKFKKVENPKPHSPEIPTQ